MKWTKQRKTTYGRGDSFNSGLGMEHPDRSTVPQLSGIAQPPRSAIPLTSRRRYQIPGNSLEYTCRVLTGPQVTSHRAAQSSVLQ
jgi:hypothetical protein